MTRVFFFLFLALASSANAATIRSYLGSASNGHTVSELPETFTGGVAFYDDVDWQIQDLTVDDIDTVFVLDSSTETSYSLTMQTITDAMWQDRLDGLGLYIKPFVKTSIGEHIIGDTGSPSFSPSLNNPETFEVISVEYRLRVNNEHILAEGWITYVIPEPSTFLLILTCLPYAVLRSKVSH